MAATSSSRWSRSLCQGSRGRCAKGIVLGDSAADRRTPTLTGVAHKLSSSAGGARHTLCRAIFQTSIADQGSLSPLELFPYLNVHDPSHRQEEAAMRAVSFVLALAAGIAAGDMSSENAAAQKQRELQSPGAFSSMADRATRSKALFFGSCQSHHRSALHELSPGR